MKIISKDKNNLILNIASYFISNIIQRIRNKYEDFDKDSRYISEIIIDTIIKWFVVSGFSFAFGPWNAIPTCK